MNVKVIPIIPDVDPPIFGIYEEDKMIGELHANGVSWDTSIYYISYFEIYEKNVGIGGQFIKHMIDVLKTHPTIKTIELEATEDSIEFWRKIGFVESNRVEAWGEGNTRMGFSLNN